MSITTISLPVTPAAEAGPHITVIVVALSGFVDQTNVAQLRATLVEAGALCNRMVVDLSTAEYVSSAGWNALAESAQRNRVIGGDIKLCGMNPGVAEGFSQMHFDRLFQPHQLVEDALDAFRTQVLSDLQRTLNTQSPVQSASAHLSESLVTHAGTIDTGLIPLQERILKVLLTIGPASLFSIHEHLRQREFGGIRIGLLRLYLVMRSMGLGSRKKRISYLLSR